MIAHPPVAQVCSYGAERLHANDTAPASSFISEPAATRLALAPYQATHVSVLVVSVRRTTWGRFAWSRCTGVSDRRIVYVVRLGFPRGFIFSRGIYEPGTTIDQPIDARSGRAFVGHTMGHVLCSEVPPGHGMHTPSPACVRLYRALQQ